MNILERLGIHPGSRASDKPESNGDTAHYSASSRTSRATGPLTPSEPSTTFRNVLVAIHANEMDDELVRLACQMVKPRKGRVFAIYVVEVPRTLPVDATLAEVTEKAGPALEHAVAVAEQTNFEIEPEIVQTRDYGRSLVEEAEAHECGLIIMCIPYRTDRSGRFDPGEAVSYVLKQAKCRVWVIRGQQRDT
jgi:K+-sensing histidine kinase KdpD